MTMTMTIYICNTTISPNSNPYPNSSPNLTHLQTVSELFAKGYLPLLVDQVNDRGQGCLQDRGNTSRPPLVR